MRTNVRTPPTYTHEGGRAAPQRPLQELERAVATCLLWENTFYESGSELAARMEQLCAQVKGEEVAQLAVRARTELKLRHVPLFLVRQMARLHAGSGLVSDTLEQVIQRPDELAEFLAIYWKDGKQPLSAQVKLGLARAYTKFSPYQLAKWDREGAIRLRDVLFLSHAKPRDEVQAGTWKQLVEGTLPSPETWENRLSRGEDPKVVWESLLREEALGYMALLMNLRNMTQAGVEYELVADALRKGAPNSKALPFRFVSAAKHAPAYAQALSEAMVLALKDEPPLEGATALVVDVSGSMDANISQRSTLSRWEAAGALAVLLRELGARTRVFTFSTRLEEVPNLRGLALVQGIGGSQEHGGTYLSRALTELRTARQTGHLERVIVVTDEQSHDGLTPAWAPRSYLVNVATYRPGLDTRQGWTRISGWSERLVEWIRMEESGGET